MKYCSLVGQEENVAESAYSNRNIRMPHNCQNVKMFLNFIGQKYLGQNICQTGKL